MKRLGVLVCALLLLATIYLSAWPTPVAPRGWHAPEAPEATGPYAPNEALSLVERIAVIGVEGPEYVEIDGKHRLYAGYDDGKIRRFAADGTGMEVLADTGGRPLGLRLLRDGGLIVADAYRGLLRVGTDGKVTTLVNQFQGEPLGLVDDVAVSADESTAYFTVASNKFDLDRHLLDLIEHGDNGQLYRYQFKTGELVQLLDGLHFANGVVLGPGERFLLLDETSSYRIWRYWLQGDKAGSKEIFVDNLPGFPDNITYNGRDRFWVALANPRNDLLDRLSAWPRLRKAVSRLPEFMRPRPVRHGYVLGLDAEGQVVANLQYRGDDAYSPITTVREDGEWLYFGSLSDMSIARIKR